jgi:hypothetical protein
VLDGVHGHPVPGAGGVIAEEIATEAIELTKRVVPNQHVEILRVL